MKPEQKREPKPGFAVQQTARTFHAEYAGREAVGQADSLFLEEAVRGKGGARDEEEKEKKGPQLS